MNKFLSIALGLAIALTIVAPASADSPMTAKERGEVATVVSGQQGSGSHIIAQERGRSRDSRLFSPSASPVQVVGTAPADGFDLEDATVGGAAVAALALLIVAGIAVSRSRTRRAASATS